MELKDFDYHLPEKLIAQHPCGRRDHARMMVLHRKTNAIECKHFYHMPDYLRKNDVLVINDSKVIPARLIGKKETGSIIEILLLSKKSDDSGYQHTWEVLLKPAKRVAIGTRILLPGESEAHILERISDKKWLVTFSTNLTFDQFLEKFGRTPLPPYIKRKREHAVYTEDMERYQTIYARMPGSVAAPTAGLHFSEDVLNALTKTGVHIVPVTLHVGYGTFLPLETDTIENHAMEKEYYEISKEAAEMINNAERVIAVGTTSTRVIESAVDEAGRVNSLSTYTRLFIYPGHRFKRVDGLITNFHLPRSSLLLLVCAFAGRNLIFNAYAHAIADHFRFYSYGDCMLIL